eukprot:gnl/TRDRNA2_/TRDRNA2_135506_c0_seq1.p1 gnl/TRDRNA2_/TRDRNA2_135506_c0~~gnl/TRDRNA2_/TRDRNA2_135506_c0_seq1.p1  ORF type:complete len:935 (+),score=225.21 gnl/TRDRNA2_/TRDRNA2_135506_c0_seq1:2-2806(+)
MKLYMVLRPLLALALEAVVWANKNKDPAGLSAVCQNIVAKANIASVKEETRPFVLYQQCILGRPPAGLLDELDKESDCAHFTKLWEVAADSGANFSALHFCDSLPHYRSTGAPELASPEAAKAATTDRAACISTVAHSLESPEVREAMRTSCSRQVSGSQTSHQSSCKTYADALEAVVASGSVDAARVCDRMLARTTSGSHFVSSCEQYAELLIKKRGRAPTEAKAWSLALRLRKSCETHVPADERASDFCIKYSDLVRRGASQSEVHSFCLAREAHVAEEKKRKKHQQSSMLAATVRQRKGKSLEAAAAHQHKTKSSRLAKAAGRALRSAERAVATVSHASKKAKASTSARQAVVRASEMARCQKMVKQLKTLHAPHDTVAMLVAQQCRTRYGGTKQQCQDTGRLFADGNVQQACTMAAQLAEAAVARKAQSADRAPPITAKPEVLPAKSTTVQATITTTALITTTTSAPVVKTTKMTPATTTTAAASTTTAHVTAKPVASTTTTTKTAAATTTAAPAPVAKQQKQTGPSTKAEAAAVNDDDSDDNDKFMSSFLDRYGPVESASTAKDTVSGKAAAHKPEKAHTGDQDNDDFMDSFLSTYGGDSSDQDSTQPSVPPMPPTVAAAAATTVAVAPPLQQPAMPPMPAAESAAATQPQIDLPDAGVQASLAAETPPQANVIDPGFAFTSLPKAEDGVPPEPAFLPSLPKVEMPADFGAQASTPVAPPSHANVAKPVAAKAVVLSSLAKTDASTAVIAKPSAPSAQPSEVNAADPLIMSYLAKEGVPAGAISKVSTPAAQANTVSKKISTPKVSKPAAPTAKAKSSAASSSSSAEKTVPRKPPATLEKNKSPMSLSQVKKSSAEVKKAAAAGERAQFRGTAAAARRADEEATKKHVVVAAPAGPPSSGAPPAEFPAIGGDDVSSMIFFAADDGSGDS